MEVVYGQEHVWVERRAFEGQHWAVIALGFINLLDYALIFLFALVTTSTTGLGGLLDGPIHENKVTFIGAGIKSSCCLLRIK